MTDDHCLDRDRLRRAISGLKTVEREVLLLSARHGLSNEAIAARLVISKAEVERRLADALVALDRCREVPRRRWWRRWSRAR